ncbi:MAG: hypothetical protein K940chlam3_00778 [Chlamydiae bacterium]|nr:hypothetical protein [Chlamydiota bacterium]
MESWKTRISRWIFNLYPAYRGTGARILYISDDWREVRIKVPLNWRTRNYVGTIFGGSLYSAVDPMYMLMLIKTLGSEYIVWDKSATIQFKRPGRKTLFATFKVAEEETNSIIKELESQTSINRSYSVDLVDEKGSVCTTIEKVIYIRKK